MENIYKSSKGKEENVETMPALYMINALVKAAHSTGVYFSKNTVDEDLMTDEDRAEWDRHEANLKVLKAEVIRRLTPQGEAAS